LTSHATAPTLRAIPTYPAAGEVLAPLLGVDDAV
jgi:hypothetical protein